VVDKVAMTAKKALISYSHKDEPFRAAFVNSLSTAVRAGEIELWSDHAILPGQVIDDEILSQLKSADVIFLLVSPDFIASEYCFKKELQVALERHENGRATVVPIVIRPTDWAGAPFQYLLMLPSDALPVSSWPNADEAWLNVSKSVRRLLKRSGGETKDRHISRSKRLDARLGELFDKLQLRYENPSSLDGLSFGLPSVDAITNGVPRGELTIIGSRPDHGQFELAMSAVVSAVGYKPNEINQKRRTLVLSQRLAAYQFTNRMLCLMGRVSRYRLANGQLEDDDWSRVVSAIRLLREIDVTIDDDPIRTVGDLREKLKGEVAAADLLVFDGLDYLNSDVDEREVALLLSDFARESRCAVIATTTLDPAIESRASRRPLMNDLGNWRVVENYCSKLLLCGREYSFDFTAMETKLSHTCRVSLAKTLDGERGAVDVFFWDEYGILDEPPEILDEEAAQPA
jgi:replicative DNA helicase